MKNLFDDSGMIYEVEAFLEERYQFRRNVMSGKCEMRVIGTESGDWMDVTEIVVNTIVREAKKEGIGDNKSPRQDIVEYINSMAVETYDPVKSYLDSLPEWDGNDHVERIQELNIPFYKSEDMSDMLTSCFRKPKDGEQPVWMSTTELCNRLHKKYPTVKKSHSMKIHIGAALKLLGFTSRRTSNGNVYALIPHEAV